MSSFAPASKRARVEANFDYPPGREFFPGKFICAKQKSSEQAMISQWPHAARSMRLHLAHKYLIGCLLSFVSFNSFSFLPDTSGLFIMIDLLQGLVRSSTSRMLQPMRCSVSVTTTRRSWWGGGAWRTGSDSLFASGTPSEAQVCLLTIKNCNYCLQHHLG